MRMDVTRNVFAHSMCGATGSSMTESPYFLLDSTWPIQGLLPIL
jgi:hypothetical protein